MSSSIYPACNAYAPYCHLWPAPFYNIFLHYIKNDMIFGKKKVTEHKMRVLIFSTTCVWSISHSKKNWARYQKCILFFMLSTRYSRLILIKLEFSRQFSWKYSNIKFHENPSSGSRAVPCGQMDVQMRKLTAAFRNFVNAPKNGSNDTRVTENIYRTALHVTL